jgi:cysteine desulfurase family protein
MIYFDNAATSFPKPQEVYNEVIKCMQEYAANPGRGSHNMALKASFKIAETREAISKLLNIANPLNVIFTSNATEGLNIAIKGSLKKGDHVISSVIEHNSVLRPLNYLAQEGVEVTLLKVDENGHISLQDLKSKIKNNTKAIVINHASNVLGTIQDIKEIGKIAKNYGLIFIVDASQSAGVIPIDVEEENIDLLAFPGHKGLLGPQGTGGLFIREGINIAEFKQGGTGSNSHSVFQPDFLPDKFESGTLNTPGIAGLGEGLRFIKNIGIENIKNKEEALRAQLLLELKKLSFVKLYAQSNDSLYTQDNEKIYSPDIMNNKVAVVSLNLENMDSSRVGYLLNKKDIAVRTGFHCAPLIHQFLNTTKSGTVRVSLGYYNTHEEIEAFVIALKDIYNQ